MTKKTAITKRKNISNTKNKLLNEENKNLKAFLQDYENKIIKIQKELKELKRHTKKNISMNLDRVNKSEIKIANHIANYEECYKNIEHDNQLIKLKIESIELNPILQKCKEIYEEKEEFKALSVYLRKENEKIKTFYLDGKELNEVI